MSRSPRHARRGRRVAVLAAGVLVAGTGAVALSAGPAAAAAGGGAGATLPYVEVQAESATTDGTVIGPTATYGELADEASYRKAVTLRGTGAYVEFTTPVPTNSIVVRYSIPDTSDGSAYTAPLSLYVDGARQDDLTLTNAYSWYYGGYPFTNSPGGNPHHFYDETHRLFPTTYPAGTTFRLQVDPGDSASSYTIDFADFEDVAAPLPQPAGSVSVTSTGADPTGQADATAAFDAAMSQAGPGGTVWIPAGTFKIPGHLILDDITIEGAGMWYSTIVGAAPGFYGGYVPNGGSNVHLSDFAIFGDVRERNDGAQVNGIGGALSDSTVERVWIEHEKVGAWMDGPMDNLVFSGMRIRDTTADGINFHKGVTHSRVTDSDIRNTGDDALATWSDQIADAHDSFDHDTVQYPILANGIAIYGGHDNVVSDNRVVDAGLTQGGGIHVAQRFHSTQLGRTDVLRNTLIRDGSLDPNWQFGVGALWFDARDGAMTGLTNVDDILIQQSPYEAIQFVSGSNISNVKINNATIQNTGTFVVQEQVGGAATITNSTATGTQAPQPIYNCGVGFTLTDGGGNSGIFDGTQCGFFTPTFPPYLPDNGSMISISPTALGFGTVATGDSSQPRTVTVTNSGTAAAPVDTIAASGDFSQTNTCGGSIPAGSSCAVRVTFRPTAAGSRVGTLTVTAAGITDTVPLSGTGVAPGPILAADPTALNFAGTMVGDSSAAKTVTVTNTGTTTAHVSSVSTDGDFSQTNTCSSLAVGASCAVRVTFSPTGSGDRAGSLTIRSDANDSPTRVSLSGSGIGADTDLAAGRPTSESSHTQNYVSGNATDGDPNSYWESANHAFPQWIQVDLGASYPIDRVTLKLPPPSAWGRRTQTLSVRTSTDGSSFRTAVDSAGYIFDPATGNTVSIPVSDTTARYVRLRITGNTGWPAGQISEFEVYSGGGGGTPPPSATDFAAGRPTSESSHTQNYVSGNATDGDPNSYWESANHAFPQWLQVDLGTARSASRIVLQLPASWGARDQTLSVLGSTDGTSWAAVVPSATYTFSPAGGNTVTITFPATTQRYFRLRFTANTGWPAGQVSTFQVWNR